MTNLHAIYEINEKYYHSGSTNYWNVYGEPRNVNLALRATF